MCYLSCVSHEVQIMVSPIKENDEKFNGVNFTFSAKKATKNSDVKALRSQNEKLKKSLPFTRRIFYLDLKNRKESLNFEATLKSLGAVVAVFFDQTVTHLISDRIEGSSCRSPHLLSPATSISSSGRYSVSPSTTERLPLPRSRGAAMLEKVQSYTNANYADPVSLALQWRIPVLSVASVRLEVTRYQTQRDTEKYKSSSSRSSPRVQNHFVKLEILDGIMTRRPYKNSSNSEEDNSGLKSLALCNGHGPKRLHSDDDLKVQCNGLTNSRRGTKLLSPSVSDILPLPSQRRSTRRASASWCGSSRELSQLSPPLSPISPSESELGITLRPKGTLWLPVALIGTTAEEHGNSIRRRGGSDASISSLDATKPRRKKLSPEEKLLQDNKDYFKMEVLHTKLRSSDLKLSNHITDSKRVSNRLINSRFPGGKCDADTADVNSLSESEIMKLNGVKKPKRTRRSELMNLCDEAESFMFGESSRQSATSAVTCNGSDCDQQDEDASCDDERPRRKRRSHTEAFLHDNIDYYKFETPGSRLRGQGSFSDGEKTVVDCEMEDSSHQESLVFSFQAVPEGESWYDVFRRQDSGNEWIFPPISDPANQLFLLPYELPRPAALLRPEAPDYYAKRRIRLNNIISQSLPRKSPRCHASTLAILSSLKKRKRRSSGIPEAEASPSKDDLFSSSDSDIEEMLLLDPVELENEVTTPSRRKKTEERLTMSVAAAIPLENQSTDVLDILSSYWDADKAEHCPPSVPTIRRVNKRRKFRINKTGWVKTRVKKIQKGKGAPVNTGITQENIIKSPRRNGNSPPAPPVSPCVVRVRKLSSTLCRNLGIKKNQRGRRSSSHDRSWATRRR